MSLAWEVTDEDVYNVLAPYLSLKQNKKKISGQVLEIAIDVVAEQAERVEKAVLCYTDFDDQVEAMNEEIKQILIENDIIPPDKKG
jgi:hypothetical protein